MTYIQVKGLGNIRLSESRMDKARLFLFILLLALTESQPQFGIPETETKFKMYNSTITVTLISQQSIKHGGGFRCPRPVGMGICSSNCSPGPYGNRCPPGQQCCSNGCAHRCTTVSGGGIGPPYIGIPPWCPPGSPRIRCFVNPCSIMTCPRYPWARCRPTNPCEPSCTGGFFIWGRPIPNWLCNSRQQRASMGMM